MQSNDARIIRGAAIPAAGAGLLTVVAAAIASGVSAALGAALGVAVGAGFLGVGMLALSAVGRRWPELFFGAALLIYTTQLGMLLALLLVLRDASFLHGRAFAVGVLVGVFTWLAGLARAHMKVRTPYVEVAPASSATASADRS